MTYGYARQDGVDVRVARIFNTFGPRMSPNDGRVVSNFVLQALQGEDITIYGDGEQTRSLLYIHDLIDGLILLMNSDCTEPVNLGSEDECSIKDWANVVLDVVGRVRKENVDLGGERRKSKLTFLPGVADDPPRRRPDTTRAKELLGWSPRWHVKTGIEETALAFIEHASG